jgi:hypothetical protein
MTDFFRDMGPITNGEYISFQYNVNYAIANLGYVRINITSDASGTVFATDSLGSPIQDRLIIKMSYTYPHIDEVTLQPVVGYFTLTFDDQTTWGNTDANDSAYWYWLNGIEPKVIYQFT